MVVCDPHKVRYKGNGWREITKVSKGFWFCTNVNPRLHPSVPPRHSAYRPIGWLLASRFLLPHHLCPVVMLWGGPAVWEQRAHPHLGPVSEDTRSLRSAGLAWAQCRGHSPLPSGNNNRRGVCPNKGQSELSLLQHQTWKWVREGETVWSIW